MALEFAHPPKAAEEAIQSTLARVDEDADRLHALRGTKPRQLALESPHEVFTLGLDALQTASDLSPAEQTGWRYLLHEQDRPVASAEAAITPDGKTAFSHFNSGPFVSATVEALARAKDVAGSASAGSLQPRLLHVPALHAMALWLHAEHGDDVLLPLRPAPPAIDPDRHYTVEDYVAALREAAKSSGSAGPGDTTGGG